MDLIRQDHPLRRYFAGLVDNAFCAEVGMADPSLTEYLVELLISFTHVERFSTVRNAQGRRLEQIAAMLLAISDDQAVTELERDRGLYRNIGDYSLFWAGVYPEQLNRTRRRRSDVLLDYVSQGKRSYAIVSEMTDSQDTFPPSLYRHLSDDFEICLHGLGLVRRGLESPHAARGGELVF